uniref:Putative secreted protein n=1 Tax=Anopheles marajoara TaxID=58244 RepID=A0A2M4CCU9_9DIPT
MYHTSALTRQRRWGVFAVIFAFTDTNPATEGGWPMVQVESRRLTDGQPCKGYGTGHFTPHFSPTFAWQDMLTNAR